MKKERRVSAPRVRLVDAIHLHGTSRYRNPKQSSMKTVGKVPEWLMGMTRNHMASAA
jgi:hypothetical protein